MNKLDEAAMQQVMKSRLASIQNALLQLRKMRVSKLFGGIDLLTGILHPRDGLFHDLSLEFIDEREQGGTYINWDDFDAGAKPVFRVQAAIVRKFIEVSSQQSQIGPRRDFWHFDLFLIHELLHSFQGMERGRHRGYQSRAPTILQSLDYQSDAFSVLILFYLILLAPADFFGRYLVLPKPSTKTSRSRTTLSLDALAKAAVGDLAAIVRYWGTLSRLVHAQLWHLTVFTAAMVDTNKPQNDPERSLMIASGRRFPLAKLERTFSWYLQYYRAMYFRHDARAADLGLLGSPQVEFRHLRIASAISEHFLVRDWPVLERTFVLSTPLAAEVLPVSTADLNRIRKTLGAGSHPEIILSVPQRSGLSRILKWEDESGGKLYSELFESMFDSNVEKSRDFFVDLLRKNPWLVGFEDDPIRGKPSDLAQSSKVFAAKRNVKADWRMLSYRPTVSAIIAELRAVR